MIVLALVPLLAGCIGPSVETPCVADCIPLEAPGDAPAAFRWQTCEGFVGSFYAPRQAVRDAVPEEFDLVDMGPELAGVLVRGARCERGAGDASIHPEIAFLAVLVRVQPRDGAWSEVPANLYALDALVTDESVAQALVGVGVHAQPARLTITKVLSLDSVWADVWDFTGQTLRVSAPIVRGAAVATREENAQVWFDASGAFRRVDDLFTATFHAPAEEAGVLTLQGSARSARIFPTGSVVWEAQALTGIDEIWTGAARTFS